MSVKVEDLEAPKKQNDIKNLNRLFLKNVKEKEAAIIIQEPKYEKKEVCNLHGIISKQHIVQVKPVIRVYHSDFTPLQSILKKLRPVFQKIGFNI